MVTDKYSTTEGFHGLAWAYRNVPDLHIMWLLYLCDAHQQNQSWAEAAQCAVAVAGVIMQVFETDLWSYRYCCCSSVSFPCFLCVLVVFLMSRLAKPSIRPVLHVIGCAYNLGGFRAQLRPDK